MCIRDSSRSCRPATSTPTSTDSRSPAARPGTRSSSTSSSRGRSELDASGEGTVDDQVGTAGEAPHRAGQEHDRAGDLLWCRHPTGRVEAQRGGVEVRVAVADLVPNPAFEDCLLYTSPS